MPPVTRINVVAAVLASALGGSAMAQDAPNLTPPKESALDLVNALHAAFGEHHARAVHTKGVMFEGTFTPAPEAIAITKAPIFAQGTLPILVRFSLFAGVPTLPDNAAPAAPSGFAVKIKENDGTEFDLESNQHNSFIVATVDEFAVFLRAVGASGPGVAHPTPVEKFLETHPKAKAFLGSLTYPASYATAAFFGVNAVKFTNAAGKSVYVRYRYAPRAGEHYLKPDELQEKGPNYLQEEIVQRVAKEPVVFDWYAQIAEPGDKIEDPSIAWPESRKLVKLGTFAIDRLPADPALADKRTLFLPGQFHPGVEPADPMLILRNVAYPISFGQRQ